MLFNLQYLVKPVPKAYKYSTHTCTEYLPKIYSEMEAVILLTVIYNDERVVEVVEGEWDGLKGLTGFQKELWNL